MNNYSDKPPALERIEQEAASWVLRSDRGLSASEQDELSAWLASDARHSVQWARLRGHWKSLDALGKWRPEHSAKPNPDLLAPPTKRRFAQTIPILLAAAAVAVAFLGWQLQKPISFPPAAHAPSIAATDSQRVLEDGSVVELNRDTEIQINYTASERRVRLVHGEAYFTVSRNPARPFIVTAGELDVHAVGTAFSVLMGEESVKVLVTEGHVKLLSMRPEVLETLSSNQKGASPSEVPVLSPNQQAVVSFRASPIPLQIASLSPSEIGAALSWQHRLLDFNAVPLSDVLVEFNRRNRVQMVIQDKELASIPISASFHSDNIDGFLHLLEAGFDAHIERRGDSEILLSRRH